MDDVRKPPPSAETDDTRVEHDLERLEHDEQRLEYDLEQLERDLRRQVHFTVNDKPVTLAHRRATGLQIKQAAIAAGVQIELSFQLWREKHGHDDDQIADDETIIVGDGECFDANDDDDNS